MACAAVGVVAGLTLVDAGPVGAQIPDLLSTTTTAPGGTTTSLLPPLDSILNSVTTTQPAQPGQPAPSTTAAPLLKLPVPAPSTSRTTTFTPTPIPPRTQLRATASTIPRASRARATTATTAAAEESETGTGGGTEFAASLPYDSSQGERVGPRSVNMELGSEGRGGLPAAVSVAGGLMAAGLLAGVIWLKRKVREEPSLPSEPDWGW